MKKIILNAYILVPAAALLLAGCSKLLDKEPITQEVRSFDTTVTVSAGEAEDLIQGLYTYYKNDLEEFTVFDRQINGDVISDNCYAGGDNTANITLDNFTANALNGNVARDWRYGFSFIGRTNIAIHDVARCKDNALSEERKAQMLGEARFFRAFTYFDMVRLYGRVPLILEPANTSTAEALLNSTIVPQTTPDSIYMAILQDLWYARYTVRPVGASASKYLISRGAVDATLALVYATMATPNWDSVLYYCDQVIPQYSLVSDYGYLWDNQHKNNSEAIWEINYDGYGSGDQIGNWVPSICVGGSQGHYEGGGWKKFNMPSNDLVKAFQDEGDMVRLNHTVTFLDITGQFTDPNWPSNHYPFLTKFNDPSDGTNDFYLIRLADILLLKAEALVEKGQVGDAMALVSQVRKRAGLGPKTTTDAEAARAAIARERRLELAGEGIRWFDLLRTGKAAEVMSALTVKGANGQPLQYAVAPYRLLMPIPQEQINLNPKLTQNDGY